jgi:hypothetical protein
MPFNKDHVYPHPRGTESPTVVWDYIAVYLICELDGPFSLVIAYRK